MLHRSAALAFLVVGWFFAAGPVAAECTFVPPIPEVAPAVPTAREIIVGTVVDNFGTQGVDFAIRIDEVVRGDARVGERRRFSYVFPNWPWSGSRFGDPYPSCAYLSAGRGQVVAIAYAIAPAQWIEDNGQRWYQPRTRYIAMEPIGQNLGIEELRGLAALPATDSTGGTGTGRGAAFPIALVGAAFLLATMVVMRRLPPGPDR